VLENLLESLVEVIPPQNDENPHGHAKRSKPPRNHHHRATNTIKKPGQRTLLFVFVCAGRSAERCFFFFFFFFLKTRGAHNHGAAYCVGFLFFEEMMMVPRLKA
jgi:hypothetical protein